MAVTVEDFLTAFPEFQPYQFTNAAIQFWIDLAQTFINTAVWGAPALAGQPFAPYDYGVLFYSAHNIAVAVRAASAIGPANPVTGKPTGAPGSPTGITTSKQVDKVSISSDVQSIVEEGAGSWNSTTYGQRFFRLAKQFGNAPMYIGAGNPVATQTGAWAGPGYPFPGWFAW